MTERSVAKRMVDNLEKRGFVAVSKCKSNHRLKMLSLTPDGEVALQFACQTMENLQNDFFACLSEDESHEFSRLVRKLTQANL